MITEEQERLFRAEGWDVMTGSGGSLQGSAPASSVTVVFDKSVDKDRLSEWVGIGLDVFLTNHHLPSRDVA